MGNIYTYVALQQTFASPNVYLVNRHQQSGAVSPTKADPNLPHNVGVKRLLQRGRQAGSLLGHGPAHRNGCARWWALLMATCGEKTSWIPCSGLEGWLQGWHKDWKN